MDWAGEGYVLSVKKHGETSAIIEILTRDRGRHLGLVRGGVSRKLRPVLQAGNKIKVEWRARLSEHLGYFTAVARETLPEREGHPGVYDAFEILIDNFHDKDIWPALYIQWEAGLLAAMGYGLDLSRCAATGATENLTHISPRSGRAVCAEAAEPYLDKLYALPGFMRPADRRNDNRITADDIEAGLKLTGYFLETRVQWGVNRTLPEARARMINILTG